MFLVDCHVGFNNYKELVIEKKSKITIGEKDDKISKLRKLIEDKSSKTNAKIDEVKTQLDGL